uniref:Fimbrial subunit protein C-terminal domain-containing protein n=2 Tax=termite gut metagenome TaxID=433724 RepID=S0DGS1_9ZZZZ
MKKQIFAMATLMAFGLVGCVKEVGNSGKNPEANANVAYLSINVETKKETRGGSNELKGSDAENAIKSLYLVTFDASGKLVGIPGGSSNYIAIIPGAEKPAAVKISAAAKNLMVIANPGTKLLAAINALTTGNTFTNFNAAIADVTIAEIVGDTATGFAMITGGDEAASPVLDPFVNIDGRLSVVTTTEADAKAEAEKPEKRVTVKLERISSKLVVKPNPGGVTTTQQGASFTFGTWTVDALNETYFPFAEKTLGNNHTPGDYAKNFYTKDPNYSGNTGIVYGTVDSSAGSYAPILPWDNHYGWIAGEGPAYVIENTMEAAEQKFENATRIVLKAKYYPAGLAASGDWFSFAGLNYNTLGDLRTAYGAAADGSNLKNACNDFHAAIEAYYAAHTSLGTLAATGFADLTTDELAAVQDGGEVMKGENMIRWYQGGQNYYYYEIRHDNEADGTMAFGKYGVVRNNWYNLTLNNVSGPGTPWYPDINNPGPGDPDPENPIDDEVGYLGITVSVAKWIVWDTGFNI